MPTITTADGTRDLLQGLGHGPADRVQPRLAAVRRRLGHPDDVLPAARLSRHRPRPPRPRPVRQVADGHDMDHYADDLAAVIEHLDLHDAVHIGHSTGGGEVVRYIARHGESRVAKAVLISAVPPLMLKTDGQPRRPAQERLRRVPGPAGRQPRRSSTAMSPAGPFYGFNRPGVEALRGRSSTNWWRQGMMGGAKAHYDGIVAFSQTDFTEDLKKITVPALVMHGDDDQIVPYADSGPLSAKLLQNGTLKTYHGFPHGMPTTHADVINADLLAFIKG